VERARREALRRDEDRARFTVAAALLRLAVAGSLAVPPADVVIDRACPTCGKQHGRPRLPGDERYVSVSHSGQKVAVAVTTVAPVGVDVELIAPVNVAGLSRHVLAPAERADSLAEFYAHWTRKEAVVKATGDGLRAPLEEVVVGADGRVAGYPGRPELVAVVVDLAPGAGYAGALALLTGAPPVIVEHDAGPLLAG
jgi:4'-phosphopantetheinyl transferase